MIDRFLSLPTSGTAYVLGHVLAETAGLVVALTVLSLTGLVIGWRTHTSVAEIVAAYALLLMFGNAIVWLGTYIGLTVRSADAVTGVVFVVVFPLTFLSNAFVPIGTLLTVLEYTAAYNPVSVLVAAVRELFGNPTAPVSHSVWPLEHPVVAALGWCLLLLAAAIPLTLHRFRQRTTN